MGDTIKTRKGSKAALDADPLLLAELGFVTDEERVYIGGNTGNIPLPNAADLSEKAKLTTTPQKTTANITYYVNASTGSDTTGDGLTSGTAFKTIQKAINMLPQVINHVVDIYVASGTYNEEPVLEKFLINNTINIIGGTDLTSSDNYIVTRFIVRCCTGPVLLKGFKVTKTGDYAIVTQKSNYVYITSCKCNATDTVYEGIHLENTKAVISTCEISNRFIGIKAMICSTVSSSSNSGTGNTYGLGAYDGTTIGKGGTQPGGTTAEFTMNGGQIR